jgi:glycosyltransferase involved in cell wall biosynthesis
MQSKKDLFFIFYSFLYSYGGGIESWLIKFLDNRYVLYRSFAKIHILYLESNVNQEMTIPFLFKDTDIDFIPVLLKKRCVIFKGFEYQIKCLGLLKKINNQCSVVFGLGSFHELFVVSCIKKNLFFKKGFWLRNILRYTLKIQKAGILSSFILKMEPCILRSMDFVIANGTDTYNYYKRQYGLNNIFINKNAIDESMVHVNKNPFRKDITRIGYIGRLEKDKGFDCFLKSIEQSRDIQNIDFFIIGFGSLEDDIRKTCKKYSNVIFKGALSNKEVYSCLSLLDATVHLTRTGGGGLSNSLLESIFSDNLIICWNNPIFTQIANDDNAVLIEEGDILQLTNAYKKISSDREFALGKIRNARALKDGNDMLSHMNNFLNIVDAV